MQYFDRDFLGDRVPALHGADPREQSPSILIPILDISIDIDIGYTHVRVYIGHRYRILISAPMPIPRPSPPSSFKNNINHIIRPA